MGELSEQLRLETLGRLQILDTDREQVYEDAVCLASHICGTRISMVSLIDRHRQWFKAKLGVEVSENPREASFCAHAIHETKTFVVEDATRDPRFSDNELVTSEFHLRFYAGAPIYADEVAVGTVCVLGMEPRTISAAQIQALEAIARQVSAQLQLRLHVSRIKEQEEELASKNKFVEAITNAAPGLIAYWDKDLKCQFANDAYREWFGFGAEDLIGQHVRDVLGNRLFDLNHIYIDGALHGDSQLFERTLTKASGEVIHTQTNYMPDFDANGQVKGFSVLVSNITKVKERELQLKLSENVLVNMREGSIVADGNGQILWVNPAFTSITGYAAEQVVGSKICPFITGNRVECDHCTGLCCQSSECDLWEGEVWSRRSNGQSYRQELTLSIVRDADSKPIRRIVVFRDITARYEDSEKMRQDALYDRVTKLPNGKLLTERLSQLLAQATRTEKLVAVLFCDLDGFKAVNDRYGHAAGDTVLRVIAERLQTALRQTDTVARFGGDEFVIVLDNPHSRTEIEQISDRILEAVGMPIEIPDATAQVGISIGIATNGLFDESPENLLARADEAMYVAKKSGKNQYRFSELIASSVV